MTTPRKTQAMRNTPTADLIEPYLTHLALTNPDSTVTTYRTALYLADRELPDGILVDTSDLASWLATRPRASTRAVYRAALTSFFRWAAGDGLLDYNPAAALGSVKVRRGLPRPCTHEQLSTILTDAREPMRSWSLVAAYAGARAVEISRLRLPDDITQQNVYLHGKGDRHRVVPTHPLVWEMAAGRGPGLLAGGAPRKRVYERCNREYRRIGVPVTVHRLRHWYGTYVQAAGGNSRVTQELLGHSDLATTQVYTAVAAESSRAAVLGLPVVAGAAGPAPS